MWEQTIVDGKKLLSFPGTTVSDSATIFVCQDLFWSTWYYLEGKTFVFECSNVREVISRLEQVGMPLPRKEDFEWLSKAEHTVVVEHALDKIAKLCGYEAWENPEQVVQAVENLVLECDNFRRMYVQWATQHAGKLFKGIKYTE